MPELQGLSNVISALQQLKKRYYETKPPPVVVGYTQSYALYVHEVPANHSKRGRTGKWKYLTDPARRLNNDGTLKDMILSAIQQGTQLNLAMLRAGMRLQRESQQEVPVDTSALKASAFTAYEQEVEGKARAVFEYSEGVKEEGKRKKRKKQQKAARKRFEQRWRKKTRERLKREERREERRRKGK